MDRKATAHISYEDGLPVLHIKGQLSFQSSENIFENYAKITAEPNSRILISFAETEYINSSGVSVLVEILRQAKKENKNIEFSDLNQNLQNVFNIIGLSSYITIHQNIKEALASPPSKKIEKDGK